MSEDYSGSFEPAKGDEQTTDHKGRASSATTLVHLVKEANAELWHGPDASGFITVGVKGHCEHYPLASKQARDYLSRLYYTNKEKVPSASALQDAIGTLSGIARYDGAEHEVSVRIAGHNGTVFLDLGDPDWRAVRVTASGWALDPNPPVRFRRPRGLRALPAPVRGGSLDQLRELVNVEQDKQWVLIMGWLVGTLRTAGPYPVLSLSGEQGSAKSTTARLLRGVVDPHEADLRAEPREVRDLMIAASSGHVVALDNISRIQDWLSDALCRLSTGGTLGSRTLYTNDEETILSAQRPIILTGIAEVATRGDLLDRTLSIALPPIPEERRCTEAGLLERYQAIHPGVLGALLDAVACALKGERDVRLDQLPRLADWARWVTAAEPTLGWESGTLLRAHAETRREAVESFLEGDRLAVVLRSVELPMEGRPIDLLEKLTKEAGFGERVPPRDWPRTPRGLSAALAYLRPALRQVGIDIKHGGRNKRGSFISIQKVGGQPSPPSQPSPEEQHEPAQDGGGEEWVPPGAARTSRGSTEPGAGAHAETDDADCGDGDGGDGGDGRTPPLHACHFHKVPSKWCLFCSQAEARK